MSIPFSHEGCLRDILLQNVLKKFRPVGGGGDREPMGKEHYVYVTRFSGRVSSMENCGGKFLYEEFPYITTYHRVPFNLLLLITDTYAEENIIFENSF